MIVSISHEISHIRTYLTNTVSVEMDMFSIHSTSAAKIARRIEAGNCRMVDGNSSPRCPPTALPNQG